MYRAQLTFRTQEIFIYVNQKNYENIAHDVYNTRMAETQLATDKYVWPAAVDTLTLVKT